MTRWFFDKKRTTDAQLRINVKKLKALRYFMAGGASGTIEWTNGGMHIASMDIDVRVNDQEKNGCMRFSYTHNKTEEMHYSIDLIATSCHFGGVRWWFICPLSPRGVPCGRRVGVLYLGGKYVGCRYCYDLTYQSCQASHRFDRLARSMGFPNKKALEKACFPDLYE